MTPEANVEPARPSFSIFIETANLRLARATRLHDSLASIAAQVPPPSTADEVVLLEDGALSPALLADVRQRFPWLETRRISSGLTYGDHKALSATASTSDVLVLVDPDCVYQPGWLGALLDTFADDATAAAVAGETTIAITGPFTLAAALFYFFPRFSGETAAAPARGFFLNNVAFRREALLRQPIPFDLPLRGGQNVVYSRLLDARDLRICRQPNARALHAPPEDLWMALRILYSTGRDTSRFDRLAAPPRAFSGDYEPYGAPAGRVGKIVRRLRDIGRQQPGALSWLPLAGPIAAAVLTAFFVGRVVERLAGDRPSTPPAPER